MQVGFIGLGTMGAGMAANVQKAGYQLIVHDLKSPELGDAASRGRRRVGRQPPVAGRTIEVIFTSLPGPPEVEAVALAADGLIEGMQKGSAWFDLTTNSPTLVRQASPVLQRAGPAPA